MKAKLLLIAAAALAMTACASRDQVVENVPPGAGPGAQVPPQQRVTAIPGSVEDFQESAGDRVFYDFDRHDLRADARATLDRQAEWLNRYGAVTVRVYGNADERGTREYNLALGARRANAARDYLVSRGVASSRIETISNGQEQPVCSASTEECWALNRNATTVIVSGAVVS